jgi:hypothetical protein
MRKGLRCRQEPLVPSLLLRVLDCKRVLRARFRIKAAPNRISMEPRCCKQLSQVQPRLELEEVSRSAFENELANPTFYTR